VPGWKCGDTIGSRFIFSMGWGVGVLGMRSVRKHWDVLPGSVSPFVKTLRAQLQTLTLEMYA
jgi:hypothetical protein